MDRQNLGLLYVELPHTAHRRLSKDNYTIHNWLMFGASGSLYTQCLQVSYLFRGILFSNAEKIYLLLSTNNNHIFHQELKNYLLRYLLKQDIVQDYQISCSLNLYFFLVFHSLITSTLDMKTLNLRQEWLATLRIPSI
jgi:hypothetical protein